MFSSAEMDLGVLAGSKPNTSQNSILAASHILGCISMSTNSRSRKAIVPQHLTLVRPQLEHRAAVCSSQFQRNTEKLEEIQKGVMKMVKGMQNLI